MYKGLTKPKRICHLAFQRKVNLLFHLWVLSLICLLLDFSVSWGEQCFFISCCREKYWSVLFFAKCSKRFGKFCRSLYSCGQENSIIFSNKKANIQISKKRSKVRRKAQNSLLQFYDSKSRITSTSNHEKTVPDTAALVFALHCIE